MLLQNLTKPKWNKHSELTKLRNQCFIASMIMATGDGRKIYQSPDENEDGPVLSMTHDPIEN